MLGIIKLIFCYTLLILAALVQVPVLSYNHELNAFVFYDYSLLFITAFTLSIAFKNNYCFFSVLLYLVSGLAGLPIFAFGGAWQYIFEPSFGFLLALIPLSIISFYNKYNSNETGLKTFCNSNLTPLYGLITAHIFGLIFLFITGRFRLNEFFALHIYQLLYDLIFGYFVIVIMSLYDKNIGKISSEQDLFTDL